MAPARGRGGRGGRPSFDRGRGRGGYRGSSRGMSRGRGSSRARGRGGRKSSFATARVEQPGDEDPEASGSNASDPESGGSSEVEAISEDDEGPISAVPAFSALLQSLNEERSIYDPPTKRRKLRQDDRPALPHDHEEVVSEDPPRDGLAIDDGVREVEDEEEDEADGLESAGEEEDDGDHEASDPFDVHFASPDDAILSRRLESIRKSQWESQQVDLGKLGRAVMGQPAGEVHRISDSKKIAGPDDLHLKSKLVEPAKTAKPVFSPLESSLASYIFNHQDLLYCGRTLDNAEGIRTLYSLHALNHILKTRDRVIKNNAKLSSENSEEGLELRDQGFTRPKVLIILPTRQSCVRVVNTIISLCEPDQQEYKKRFADSYVDSEEKFSDDKPTDFRDLFGGNDDDMFRVGLKFTRKTVKFFSSFYNSDIIFASPLGLRMAIGTDDDKKQDHDFLSSIELLILDQTDALLMQNWEHLTHIVSHLNLQPTEAHGCDFSHVRSWYLDGHARHLRQTLVFSAFNTPDLNSLFSTHMQNVSGRVKLTPLHDGSLLRQSFPCKQTFSRFDSPSPVKDPDARFEYFCTAILPSLLKSSPASSSKRTSSAAAAGGTLIYIPSTLDFIRLRNHLALLPSSSTSASLSFGSISEYTPTSAVARARSHFLTGRHSVLLYTERAHHFRRYRVRGVRRVVFYGLPDNPVFYEEVVAGFLGRSVEEGRIMEGSVKAVFGRWDGLKVERIVGSERVGGMVRGGVGDTFEFV